MYRPPWQIPGVFVTAVVLALIQLRWCERFLPGAEANLVYGAITFCCVLLIYALDHLFDLIKYEQKHQVVPHFKLANIIISVVSAAGLATLVAFNAGILDFKDFWVPLLPSLAFTFAATRVLPFMRGFKEMVIALSVAAALCYPLLHEKVDVFFKLAPPTFLVCYMNLLAFGFFEKPKDEMYGFRTIYTGIEDYTAFRRLFTSFVICSLLLVADYFWIGNMIFPFLVICLGYWLMILGRNILSGHPIYRWIADLLLLIMIW